MVRAYVLINTTAGKALEVCGRLQGQEGVVRVDAITGEYDVIAQIEAADVASLGKLIVERVQAADGVFKTITCLAIQ